MNKTIRNLAIAALFIFPGLSGFPQEVQQDETPAAKPVVEENVAFPILIGIPWSNRQSRHLCGFRRKDGRRGAKSCCNWRRSGRFDILYIVFREDGDNCILWETDAERLVIVNQGRLIWRDVWNEETDDAVVGACACVFKDVEDWTVVGGNPAQVIRRISLQSTEKND